jgi:hypothetical protein
MADAGADAAGFGVPDLAVSMVVAEARAAEARAAAAVVAAADTTETIGA